MGYSWPVVAFDRSSFYFYKKFLSFFVSFDRDRNSSNAFYSSQHFFISPSFPSCSSDTYKALKKMSSTTVKTIGQPSVVLAQAAPIDMVKEESSNAIAEDQIQKQPAVVVVAVSTEIESSKAQEQIPIDMVEEPKAIAEVQDQALSSSSENKRKSSENQTANVEESQSPAKKAKTAEEMDALMADCGSPTPTCGC